ncbi:pleckstrin homology domain-containing family G member 1 isoform X1 [Tachysurus vachellii]|uniref:pleckstrin homology domain-containing family G member 1 isoform X1 n=2 Tax=Tachysurus vachellii TaxID=175792 RepID=UPI00296B0567|nr:pleckstrin homology domain-containing family G member 1 isoform X1 [Tachysurus vachellii]
MPTEEFPFSPDVLPPLLEVPILEGAVLSQGAFRNPALRHCSSLSMDSAQCNDRPVSYTSTSSSSSSRDSNCSAVLGSAIVRDRDSGAIRLELVPARQLEEAEPPAPANQDEERKVAYVDHVVQEILETERTYVQDLQSIVQDYFECISNQARPMLGLEDRNSLFGNIQEIYCFNRHLLYDLEKCNADPVAIAHCFVAKSEEFHIYTQYCTNYPRSVAVLSECMRNKSVAKFLRERQECAKHSLPLGSFLLKPVQRILKYHLLLHEIATHLEKDSERHPVVQEAIDTMQRVAWHINDMKRKHENTVRLQEIQSLLTNWQGPDLIGYGELVLEGTFRVQRVKNERTLFLFDKLLLITKKREENYAYKAHILCCNLMLVEVIPKEPLSFSVFHYKNPKLQHTVQAKSQQDKRTWIQHLKRLILENHPAKIPAKAKKAILEMDVHQFSPEGQNRINLKEGPSPRRARRKTEPLSKLLKNKHAISSPDIQKRSSFGATLLSPVVHLGTIGRSRSLVSQSQESLDPGDHGDHSDVDEGLHPQDADDEDDSGLGSGGKLRVPGKSSRKRLNAQVSVDSIDQWKNHSLDHIDLQTAKESLQKETVHTPILRVTCPSETRVDDQFSQLLGRSSGHSVPNIWADHRVRRAMFPTRQKTVQIDDDEDIYQMFVPTENDTSGHDAESDHDAVDDRPGRPCSWHVEQTKSGQLDLPASRGKVLRRASSVGEQQSERQSPTKRAALKEEVHDNTESSSNEISGSSSAEQLTIDDIENVYDNISYEELQAMGLIRKDLEVNHSSSEEKPVVPPQILVSPVEFKSSSESNRSSGQEGAPFESAVQTPDEEENVYDTIVFHDLPPSVSEKGKGNEQADKQDYQHSPMKDLTFSQNTGTVVIDETPNLEYSKATTRPLPQIPTVSITDMDRPSTLDKTSEQSVADHMSEQVDEIWNDLENYIRDNEKKPDKLPAAFPVNRPESPRKIRDSQGKKESSLDKLHNSPTKAVKSQPKSQESQEKTRKSHQSPSKKCSSGRKTTDSQVKTDVAKKVKKSTSSPSSPAFHPIPTFKFPVLSVPKLVREPTFEIDEPESPPSTPPATPSHSQVSTSAPQVSTSAPQISTSAPQVSTSAPRVSTQVSTSAPQVSIQVSSPAIQVSSPAPQVSCPAPQVSGPAPQVSGPAPQVSGPAPQVSGPAPQVSCPAPQVSGPAPQVSCPAPQVSSPAPQVSSPAPQVSSPAPQVSSPAPQVSSPAPQVSTSVPQVLNPLPQVSNPVSQVSSPVPHVQVSCPIPEIQISSPEPPPGTVKSIRNKLARLSSGSFRMDDEDPPTQKDPELQTLFSGLDPAFLPLTSSGLLLAGDAGDQLLDLGEKGRNRVFLMARQYSQKIKKANQLLKMKSMDHEPSCTRLRTNKAKDLAAILEEKKQGGAAIGARIAEYSHLYEQVMFKEPSTTTPVLKSSASVSGPHPLYSRSSLASSPSLPESAFPETDWLNCTYSNGELAGFVSWPAEVEGCSSTPQQKLSPAISAPPLKNLPPPLSTPSNQRWSGCVTPASKDDSEHVYSTLGQHNFKTPLYSRCQSSSSLAEQQEKENSRSFGNLGQTSRPGEDAIAGHGLGPRQRSLPESPAHTTSDLSQSCDLTLRDSQQVLVLDRQTNLNAISATQNYLANFKDNGDDDDDYVEIRSEDESDGMEKGCTVSPQSALHSYVWNDPDDSQQALNQPKIVQSLREKFQCLGSSSFA